MKSEKKDTATTSADVSDTSSAKSTIPVKDDTGNHKDEDKGEDKSSETTTGPAASPKVTMPLSGGPDNMIDVEDPDDYLLYLETILRQIHKRFYKHYDENSTVTTL